MRGLQDLKARRTSLREQAAGRALVVVVMKGHWCPVCVGQLVRLGEQRGRLNELGAFVVGLNADGPKANRIVAAQKRLVFPVLSDETHAVIERLGLWFPDAGHPMPAMVVFDRCGDEAGRLIGRSPGDRPEPQLFELLEKLRASKRACGRPNA